MGRSAPFRRRCVRGCRMKKPEAQHEARSVKRFLLFCLLGPPLGMAFAIWLVLPLWDVLHGHAPVFHGFDGFAAFQLGLAAAIFSAVFDWFMRKKKWRV